MFSVRARPFGHTGKDEPPDLHCTVLRVCSIAKTTYKVNDESEDQCIRLDLDATG